MFSLNWFEKLNNSKHQKTSLHTGKNKLAAVICNGKTRLSDKESCLKDEIKWLEKNKATGITDYFAILTNCNNSNEKSRDCLKTAEAPTIVSSKSNISPVNVNQQTNQNEIKYPEHMSDAKIFMANSVNNNLAKKKQAQPPYTFLERTSNVYYSMLIDNEPDDISQLFRLSGFVDWLSLYKPELLFSQESNNSEYMFYWLIYNIVQTSSDILNGLYKSFNAHSNHNIGGLFNIFFSDGTGVYAFSNKEASHNGSKTISFKINRDEQNIFSYILRNSDNHDDLDWIHLKANSLYYFPTQGPLQNYLNIDTPSRAEVKLKKCMYWSCLSLISANLV